MDYKQKLKRNLKLYYIVDFLVGLDFAIPTWVAFQTRVLSFTEIGLFHAYVYGLQLILELPTGALADLLGRKRTLLLGWFLQALGAIYIAFTGNTFSDFFVSFTLMGIGAAFVSGSDVALIYDTHKELDNEAGFSSYIARASFIFRLGLSAGTFLGGYLYQIFIGLPYLMMGLLELLSLLFILLMVEPKIDSEKFSFASYFRQTKDGFGQIWKNSYMKRLTIFYMLAGGISWSCAAYFNQPLAFDLGFNEIEMSWIFGIVYLLVSLIVLYLAHSKLITRPRVYVALPIIMVFALLGSGLAIKWLAPLLFLFLVFTTSARFAFLDRFTNEEFESKYRATAISSLNMLVGIFYVIAVTIGGKVQDTYQTPLIYTALGIIALFVMLPIGINLARHKRVAS